jgi:hypothetical protein
MLAAVLDPLRRAKFDRRRLDVHSPPAPEGPSQIAMRGNFPWI